MLTARTQVLVRHGLSENTQDAYLTGRRHWLQFRRDIMPGDYLLGGGQEATGVLGNFISHLSFWLKHSTIKGYLAAVRHFHISHGRANPMDGCELLRLQLRGIRRAQGDTRLYMKPITPDMLRWAKRVLFRDLDSSQHLRTLWCALLIAYFALLRCSEYCPKGGQAFDPERQLAQGDSLLVERPNSPDFLLLHIGRSKADPFGRGHTVAVGATGGPLCPVDAWRRMKRGQPQGLGDQDPLFWTQAGALRREAVVRAVKDMAAGRGKPPAEYSSHSLRRGGASALWAQGFSREQIMVLGRWSSLAYRLYVQEPYHRWATAAKLMARAVVEGDHPEHQTDWGSSVDVSRGLPPTWRGSRRPPARQR